MIQIANMVIRQGDKEPFIRNVFTLNMCAPIVGAEVKSFGKEADLLSVSGVLYISENKKKVCFFFCIKFKKISHFLVTSLHFTIRSSISIPPALSPSRLFILLLFAGDINPNPGPPKCLNITYANIRSINNKYPAIAKFICDNDTDLFAMSETWIRPDITSANLSEITPTGYSLYQQPRAARRGGGLR